MQGYNEARTRQPKKELEHLLIKKGARGGHVVEHHYKSGFGPGYAPEVHPFSKGDESEMLGHVMKHMGIDEPVIRSEEEHGETTGSGPGRYDEEQG
jgi:hypothetical protein